MYHLQENISKNGYSKISFKETGNLKKWKNFVKSLDPSDSYNANQKTGIPTQSYHCTFFDSNMEYRKKVFDKLKIFFQPVIDEHLNDYKIVMANIFIKPANSGYVYPHQNLTIVDESKYSSLSLWCPLQDTTIENGTMQLIPNSHKRFSQYRNTDIYWPLMELIEKVGKEFLETINVQKGEVLVLDDSIIHGTPINKSSKPRIVFHAMLIPKDATTIYCDLNKVTNKVTIFEVEEDFWQYHIPGSKPKLKKILKIVEYDDRSYSIEQFQEELIR